MPDIDLGQTVKKVPTWGWVAVGGGVLIGLWLVLRGQGSNAGNDNGQAAGAPPNLSDAMAILGTNQELAKLQQALNEKFNSLVGLNEDSFGDLSEYLNTHFGDIGTAISELDVAEASRYATLTAALNQQFTGAVNRIDDLKTLIDAEFGQQNTQWTAQFQALTGQMTTIQQAIVDASKSGDTNSQAIITALNNQLAAVMAQLKAIQQAASTPNLNLSQVTLALDDARRQLGAQHPDWLTASLVQIIGELRSKPQLMAGQANRQLLVNLPI
jgi:hypothetical protein